MARLCLEVSTSLSVLLRSMLPRWEMRAMRCLWERHGGCWVVVCTAGMAAMVAALLEGDQGEQILEVYGRAVNRWL